MTQPISVGELWGKLKRNRLYHLNETIDGGYGDIGVDGRPFHGDRTAPGGHRYVSSTEAYLVNDLEGLAEDVERFHPIG